MSFSNLVENPQETTLLTAVIGTFLSQGLTATELNVLGRLIIYFGEAFVTISILQAAKEALEALATNNHKAVTDESDEAKVPPENVLAVIMQLQQENQNLQEQIWALQEMVSLL